MTNQHYESLKSSPLFAFSLGSRELFHTNYLAWLFQQKNSFIEEIFDVDIKVGTTPKILREKHNMDLIILLNNNKNESTLIAVEIKIKDTPKINQLIKYNKSLEERFSDYKIKRFLFSMPPVRSQINTTTTGWNIKRFKELSEKLRWVAKDDPLKPPSHQAILIEYLDLLDNLHEVFKIISKDNSNKQEAEKYWWATTYKENQANLKEIRFDDTIKKYYASNLLDDVLSKLEEPDINANISNLLRGKNSSKGNSNAKFDFYYGLTNKTPLMGVCLECCINKKNLKIGIQIQGSQYRRYIEFDGLRLEGDKGKKSRTITEFINKTDKYEWLFRPEVRGKAFEIDTPRGRFSVKTSIRENSPFCSYAPSFIYQYVDIHTDDPKCISPAELTEQISHDIELAYTLISNDEYVERYYEWLK